MNLNIGVILTVFKILIFLGLGIFMIVAGDRIDIDPTMRIGWGVALILFGVFRIGWLIKKIRESDEYEEDDVEA